MKHRYTLIVISLFFISMQPVFSQTIWYVSSGGSGNGSSWGASSGDLQSVINNAQAGDQIWVKQGSYQRAEGQNFAINNNISVYGGFPDTDAPGFDDRNPQLFPTVLNGNQARVLQVSGVFESLTPDTIIDGFTIQNGYANVGAGIWIYNCDATFRNLIVKDNTSFQGLGGGLSITNSNSTFLQVLIHHNTTELTTGFDGEAAAMRVNASDLKFYNCVIADNHAEGYIGGVWLVNSEVYFYNSIIYGNTADNQFSSATNDNYYNSGSSVYASHCILQGCGSSDFLFEGSQYQFYGNDLSGNRSDDPLFNADYSLQSGSYGINHGNTVAFQQAAYSLSKDFFGNDRVVDRIDIGLSENQNVQSEILYVRQNGTGDGSSWANASGNLQLMMDNQFAGREVWVAAGTYFAPSPYFRLRDSVKVYGGFPADGNPGFADRDPVQHTSTLTSVQQMIVGNCYPADRKISAETLLDGFTFTSNQDSPAYMYGLFEANSDVSYSNIIFTNLHYSAVENRRNSNNSFTDCIFADNIAIDTPGVHNPCTVLLLDGATSTFLRCSFTGNYAFLGSAMQVQDDSHVIVDQCVFAHNDNNVVSGVGKVVLILNSEALITDSVFEDNGYGEYDGGILAVWGTNTYPDAPWMIHPLNVTIDRCTFKNNQNSALYYQGKDGDFLSTSNSLFFSNNSAGVGGGLRRNAGGDLYLTNCTFTKNHASNSLGGAIFMSDAMPNIPLGITEMRNCIIYDNTANYLYGPNFWTYRPVGIKNSLIAGSGGSANWDGGAFNDFTLPDFCTDLGGNLDTDPMFWDPANHDYRLLPASPAVNAGDSALFTTGLVPDLSAITLDLSGNTRILQNTVDMGAFEYDPEMGSEEIVLKNGLIVYPNPAEEIVWVRAQQDEVSQITLYDLSGKLLLQSDQSSLDVSALSSGVYILEAVLSDGVREQLKLVRR